MALDGTAQVPGGDTGNATNGNRTVKKGDYDAFMEETAARRQLIGIEANVRRHTMRALKQDLAKALLNAARDGDRLFVELVVEAGADVNARGEGGVTALHLAAEAGHEDIVRFLVDHGADLHAETAGGWTALHAAAASGSTDVVLALLNAGADPNARDARGQTPLHMAAYWGRYGATSALASHGADVDLPDADGRTPGQLAGGDARERIADVLLAYQSIPGFEHGAVIEAAMRRVRA
jgi:ankyrin repeat protein